MNRLGANPLEGIIVEWEGSSDEKEPRAILDRAFKESKSEYTTTTKYKPYRLECLEMQLMN